MNNSKVVAAVLVIAGLMVMAGAVAFNRGIVVFELLRDASALAQYQLCEQIQTGLAVIGLCIEVAGLVMAWRITRHRNT